MCIVKCAQDTQCTAGLSCNQMIMEYARDKYYNMHRNSRCIILVDVIRTVMCLDHFTSVSMRPTALVNAGHPQTIWTQANEVTIIAAMERESLRSSCNIAQDLGVSQPRFLGMLLDHLDPCHFWWKAHLFPDSCPLHLLHV
jgi:hypothetical protein